MWAYDDGGRTAAGFKGDTRDCVTRAIAIATGIPYREVYDLIIKFAERERGKVNRRTGKKWTSHPRTGVSKATTRKVMDHLGWEWVPTMGIGTGCRVHLVADELPSGRLVCQLSSHVSAVVDGQVRDTYDPSRDGTRCVYGYWRQPNISQSSSSPDGSSP